VDARGRKRLTASGARTGSTDGEFRYCKWNASYCQNRSIYLQAKHPQRGVVSSQEEGLFDAITELNIPSNSHSGFYARILEHDADSCFIRADSCFAGVVDDWQRLRTLRTFSPDSCRGQPIEWDFQSGTLPHM
jgi:hypothetical protein